MFARQQPARERLTVVSIAQPPSVSAPSLREIAAQAWERQQAEVAERKRQEQEAAIERFRSEALRSLRVLANSAYEPFSPFSESDISAAEIAVECSADGIPFEATISFAGEWFRYCANSAGAALYHVWACPICGDRQESTTSINSLADLGYWLEQAPKRCYHGGDL